MIYTNKDLSKDRKRIQSILEQYEYGKMPEQPKHLSAELISEDRGFAAGKASLTEERLTAHFENGTSFSFHVRYAIPRFVKDSPILLHLNYTSNMPDKLQPTEELCDGGFTVFTLAYEDITKNNGNFKNGIAPYLTYGRRKLDSPGKLAMWAWGAMRAMDYIKVRRDIFFDANVAIIGHGILGAAALLAGALDERFSFVIAKDSGFGGAAKASECAALLLELKCRSPHLFCKRYAKSRIDGANSPEQKDLLSLIAPRKLFIDTSDDGCSNSAYAEFMSVKEASTAFTAMGEPGLLYTNDTKIHDNFAKNEPISFTEGNPAYRKRNGISYISREDWHAYMNYIKNNI